MSYSRRLENVLEQIEIMENNLNKNLIQEFSKYLISKDTSANYQRNWSTRHLGFYLYMLAII